MGLGCVYQRKQKEITALKLYNTTTVDEIYGELKYTNSM